MALINRDPFARQELHRDNVFTGSHWSCYWCGQQRTTKNGKIYLYRYEIQTDGGSNNTIKGLFCSKDCMVAYHGNP